MKKGFYLLLCVIISLFCLFSCSGDQTDDDPSSEQNAGVSQSKTITLVYTDPESRNLAYYAAPDIMLDLGVDITVSDSSSIPNSNAIIIGNANIDITKQAYASLDQIDNSIEPISRYAIYSDGKNTAIAYDSAPGFEAATDYILTSLTADTLISTKRELIDCGYISYRERAEKARSEYRNGILFDIETIHGKDIADAFRRFYALFDDNLYIWYADLWDPVVGAFYYSNSARNNVGFLPDLESTAQLLSSIEKYGMVESYGGEWENAIPASMKTKILNFALNLQDPDDGYFYHPQWSKESTTTSRRGRDNGWALSLIAQLGGEPLYPNVTNSGGEPDLVSSTKLTNKLGSSQVSAVSKVIQTANELLPSHLQSPDAFENYIRELDLHSDSYAGGNTLAAQWRDIKAAGPDVIERMFDVFAELQFENTGMWESTLGYNAVNGLFKITSLYQHFNEPIPHADISVMGVIEVLKNPEGAEHVCSVYNPWSALLALKGTLGVVEWAQIQQNLLREAPALINVTVDKLLPCLIETGGFSYFHGRSSSTSQGMMVATPSTREADVNGTAISLATLRSLVQTLDIGTSKIYCAEDFDYFINTIGMLGEIIKDDEMVPETITFNGGFIPNNVTNNVPRGCRQYISFDVVDDPIPSQTDDEDEKDMAMCVEVFRPSGTSAPTSSGTRVNVMNPFAAGSCYAVEMDFMYESTDATSNTMTQLFLQDSRNSFAIAFNAYTKGNEKKIRIVEHASTGVKDVLATGLDFGEWIHLRLEFYRTENKAIIYINGEPTSVADLYFAGTEERDITRCSFLHYRDVASKLYLDNIICEKLDKAFVPFGPSGDNVNFGTDDGSATAEGPMTFEDNCPSADNLKVVKNSPAINSFITFDKTSDAVAALLSAGNNALKVETFSGYTDLNVSYIEVMNADYSTEANGFDKSYTFEADMYVDPATANGWISQMFLYTGNTCSYSISFRVVDMGSAGKFVRISKNSLNADRGTIIEDGLVPVGKWFNLKIVFYKGAAEDGSMTAVRYFINDKYYAQDLTYRNAAIENTAPIEYARMTFYSRDTKTLMYLDNISFTEKEELLPVEPEVEAVKSDKIVDFEDGDPDSTIGTVYTTEAMTAADLFRYSIVTDPKNAANKVLCAQVYSSSYSGIESGGTVTKVAALHYTRPDTSASETDILNSSYVYNADYYISSVIPNTAEADQTEPMGEMFAISIIQGGNQAYSYSFRFEMVDGKLCVSYGNSSAKATILTTSIGYDEWFDVNLEFYKNSGADDTATAAADGAAYRITVTAEDGAEYVGTVATASLDSRATSSTRVMKFLTAFFATSVKKTVYIDNVSVIKNIGETDYTITKTSTVSSPDDGSESGSGSEGGDGSGSDDTEAISDNLVTFEDGDSDTVTNTNNTTNGSFIFDLKATDPVNAANKCLKATVWADSYSSATANTTTVINGDYTAESKLDGNAFRFSTDLYISSDMPNSTGTSSPTGNVLQISLLNGSNKNIGTYTLVINDNSGALTEPVIRIRRNFGTKSYLLDAISSDGTDGIGFDEWFNIDFTLYVDADGNTGYLMTVSTADGRKYQYFDSKPITTTYPGTIGTDSAIKSARISWVATSTCRDVYLDNIICETIEGETYVLTE